MFRVQQTLAKKREAKERNKSRQKLHELMMRQEEGGRRRREEKEVLEMLVLSEDDGDGGDDEEAKKLNAVKPNDFNYHLVKVDDLSLMLKRDGDATIPRRS